MIIIVTGDGWADLFYPPRCYFCGEQRDDITNYRLAHAFLVETLPGKSPVEFGSAWQVCLACAVLIEDNRWEDLTTRIRNILRQIVQPDSEVGALLESDFIQRTVESFKEMKEKV